MPFVCLFVYSPDSSLHRACCVKPPTTSSARPPCHVATPLPLPLSLCALRYPALLFPLAHANRAAALMKLELSVPPPPPPSRLPSNANPNRSPQTACLCVRALASQPAGVSTTYPPGGVNQLSVRSDGRASRVNPGASPGRKARTSFHAGRSEKFTAAAAATAARADTLLHQAPL